MDFEDYYLYINKVSILSSEDDRQNIHSYYRDMVYAFSDGRLAQGRSSMNSLIRSGYLKSLIEEDRDEKINKILND